MLPKVFDSDCEQSGDVVRPLTAIANKNMSVLATRSNLFRLESDICDWFLV